nr:MAG TPA: hypothetical protein [Caudoviricetes sp.]
MTMTKTFILFFYDCCTTNLPPPVGRFNLVV